MLLHRKGTEVNKNYPKLLEALEEFYKIIEFFLSYAPTHWNAQNSMCIGREIERTSLY
jgi:hypothetical protein